MGNYNPHSPDLLGNEWVPIRQRNLAPDIDTEHGYTFRLEHSATLVSGGIFLSETIPGTSSQAHMISLYRTGQENETGPAKRVVIPVSLAVITDGTVDINPPAGGADALEHTGDNQDIWWNDPGGGDVATYFDVTSFSTQLSGKRILAVNVLYSAFGDPPNGETTSFSLVMYSEDAPPSGEDEINIAEALEVATNSTNIAELSSLSLGNTAPYSALSNADSRRYPWTYRDLQRFVFGAASQLSLVFSGAGQNSSGGDTLFLDYVAIEVIYCEENRIGFGGRSHRTGFGSLYQGPFIVGQNRVHLRTSGGAITGIGLTPGEYTVTVGMADQGAILNAGGKPVYGAIRQLYELPSHRGVQITRSTRVGSVPTVVRSDVLPAISLHTRSSTITGSHVYDTSYGSPVYDGFATRQEIYQNGGVGPATSTAYPQVRFYARRFGDTNVPLTLTGIDDANTPSVSITPDEFDELPEIVDGWKEVTLRFEDPAPTFLASTTAPDWVWTADDLPVGSQWQILAADVVEILSNVPFNSIRIATYGAPFGDQVTIAEGGTDNTSADATIIFSIDPPAVTGLAVDVAEQELVPVGTDDCGVDLSCTPTGLYYNALTWSSVIPLQVADPYTRVAASGWGDSQLGTYQIDPTANAYVFSVDGDEGVIDMDALNATRRAYLPAGLSTDDVLIHYDFKVDELPVGGNAEVSPMLRVDPAAISNTYYYPEVEITPAGRVQVRIVLRNGGTESTIAGAVLVPDVVVVPGEYLRVYAQVRANIIKVAVTQLDAALPVNWDLTGVSATLTTGRVGVRASLDSTVTNTLPYRIYVDNLLVYVIGNGMDFDTFGHYELQRQDDDDDEDEWNTILLASSPAVTGYADYEARVGVESRYRIRTVNVLDFAGSWSNEQASTVTSPGVVLAVGDGNSVLIFTTNERQDGSSNLAYVQTWDGGVAEDFAFPEADSTQLRELYRRDYVVAFRPSERGGERFSRAILVHSAAVPSGRIREGFRSLRDMAWDDVPYICVRNELGDRWFANVQVPAGRIQRNRRLYVAQINVIETTDTPCAVELPEE